MTGSCGDIGALAGIYLSVQRLARSLPESGSWAILQSISVSIASVRRGLGGGAVC